MKKTIINILILAVAICFSPYQLGTDGNVQITGRTAQSLNIVTGRGIAGTNECNSFNKMTGVEEYNLLCSEMIKNQDRYMSNDSEYPYSRLLVQTTSEVDFTDLQGLVDIAADNTGFAALQFSNPSFAKAAFDILKNNAGVKYVEADQKIEAATAFCKDDLITEGASDVSVGEQIQANENNSEYEHLSWGITEMGFDFACKKTSEKSDKNVIVAVVDSGVDTEHPFLKDRCISDGVNLFDPEKPQNDKCRHGTHVAGIIADCTKGDAGVKILPVKVLDDVGCGTILMARNGIVYAADHGAQVINMSLGYAGSNVFDDAAAYAISKGVTIVASAGNSYGNAQQSSPACIRDAITVTSLDESQNLSYYATTGAYVDVAAPGYLIKSTVPGGGYEYMSGTSMAAPHIAAFAALLLRLYPSFTPNTVQMVIKGSCDDLGEEGPDKRYGYGRPDFNKILSGDLSYRWKAFETKHTWCANYDETFKYEAYKSDTGYIRCTFDNVDMGAKGIIELHNGSGKLIGTYKETELSGRTIEAKGKSLSIKVISNYDDTVKGFKVKNIVELDKNIHITFDSGVKKINKAAGKKVKMPAAKNKTVKVTFNACGGVSPVKSLKKKAIFKGWALKEGAASAKYKAGKSYSVSGTFNLYGVFAGEKLGRLPVPSPVQGSASGSAQGSAQGSATSMKEAKFLGWYTSKEGGKKITKNTAFKKNTTVYAHWETAE